MRKREKWGRNYFPKEGKVENGENWVEGKEGEVRSGMGKEGKSPWEEK